MTKTNRQTLLNIDYTKRVYGLDVFRSAAILTVVISHGRALAGDLFSFLPNVPLLDGVELFFVLSGFLIGSMLLKQVDEENGLSFKSLFTFLKRRWFRTLPNYYLVLGANILIAYLVFNGENIHYFNYHFFFFTHNFAEGFIGFFWESWSLSVEEWFYIFLPILLLITLKFSPVKIGFLICIFILILAPLAYRISISETSVDAFWWDVNFRKVVLTRLDAIGYGVLIAYLNYYCREFIFKYRFVLFVLGLVIIYVNMYIPAEPNDFYKKTFTFSVTSLGAGLLIPLAASIKSFKIPVLGKVITHISVISYSMYLINLSIVASLISFNFAPEKRLENLACYSAYWFLVIALSTLMYKYFEKPINDLRNRL